MRIAIDATDAFAAKLNGTGVYSRELIRELSKTMGPDELVPLCIRSVAADTSAARPGAARLLRSPKYRSIWSQIRLPMHLVRNRYDLLHCVDHKLPRYTPCRTVVTVLDLAFLLYPEMFLPAHQKRLSLFTRDAVQRADRVITISHSTKRDVCALYGTDPAKVSVVHLAVDHKVYHPHVSPIRRPAPYVLAVGALQPRKNFVMLMRAFSAICSRSHAQLDLVIAGQRGWMWEAIESEARSSPVADRIHLLGYVPDEELPGLYAGAKMLVFPSLYEGFGIPLLEAMACGIPVVAANVSSLPEVVGEAALLLEPTDQKQWEEALTELLANDRLRRELRDKGIEHAAGFTWERTASETLSVYEQVLNIGMQKAERASRSLA